jgi:hypothetical protein
VDILRGGKASESPELRQTSYRRVSNHQASRGVPDPIRTRRHHTRLQSSTYGPGMKLNNSSPSWSLVLIVQLSEGLVCTHLSAVWSGCSLSIQSVIYFEGSNCDLTMGSICRTPTVSPRYSLNPTKACLRLASSRPRPCFLRLASHYDASASSIKCILDPWGMWRALDARRGSWCTCCATSDEERDDVYRVDLNSLEGASRRSMLVKFTCNACGGRSERLVNPLAWAKGMVIVQCEQCKAWHKIADSQNMVEEYRLNSDDE